MAHEWPGAHVYTVNNVERVLETPPGDVSALSALRSVIEPWLTALVGAEHLSLLIGSGLTTAVTAMVGAPAVDMAPVSYDLGYEDGVMKRADSVAAACGRGSANIEDQTRAALELIGGLRIVGDALADAWETSVSAQLRIFARRIIEAERALSESLATGKGMRALNVLSSFIGSFASRSGTRDRLNVFTTNYDRMIEFALDHSGIWKLDRFVGSVSPMFRASRLDIDLHYSPPGIRGEPRYLEGVVRLTKLHGSVDWVANGARVERVTVPFGTPDAVYDALLGEQSCLLIYPNPAKDTETSEYPYAELFRDFASGIVRPNSVLVTYGYGFGDDHINRVISDMLTIPSTHLVAIAYGDTDGRLRAFCENAARGSQISVLFGTHLADLENLSQFYLPKPSVDRITAREVELLQRRGLIPNDGDEEALRLGGGEPDAKQ